MFRVFCIIIGYGIGCLQTSYIVGKLFKKIDIRNYGSGNAGATNTVRVMGFKVGLIVFICDALKAVAAYMLCALLFDGNGMFLEGTRGDIPGLYSAIGVILGHNFPFYLKFKGGKGVASTLGVILCIDWRIAIIAYICGMFTVAFSKYISLSSLVMTGLLPILMVVFGQSPEAIALGCVITAMAYYQHRANIKRLIKGEESKFNFGRK